MSFADASVGTDKLFRERFSVLPEMKSKFVQTDASWLRSRSIAVNTDVDPFFGVWRRRRVRGTHPPFAASVMGSSRETQTDVSIPFTRDASAQVNICCGSDLRSTRQQQESQKQPERVEAHEEEAMHLDQPVQQHVQQENTRHDRGSLTSLSSMDMDPSPEPPSPRPSPLPRKQTVDQALSPLSMVTPSPPLPPPPDSPPPGSLAPLAAVEVIITPPPPNLLPDVDPAPAASLSSPSLPLPPAPRARSTVTSGTNSQNASDDDEDETENKRFKALKDEEYFKKYATRPRKGTITLRSIKARSESRRPSTRSQNESGDGTRLTSRIRAESSSAEVDDADEEMQMDRGPAETAVTELTAVPDTQTSRTEGVHRKISNVSTTGKNVRPSTPVQVAESAPKRQDPVSQPTPLPQQPTKEIPPPLPASTGTEYVERLKDPDSPVSSDKEPVNKKRKEVLSASSPNLLSDDSSSTSIVEAVNVNDAELKAQGNGAQNKMLISVTPREMRTESKIVIEVINSRRREVSEVTSYSEVQADGKITRKTTVTTSKKVPVLAIADAAAMSQHQEQVRSRTFPPRRHPGKTPEPIVTSPPSTKATSSPVPKHAKTMTTMQSVAPSECSTRPTSAAEDVAIGNAITPASSQIDSFASSAASPDTQRPTGSSLLQPRDTSHFLSPAYSDPEVEKVAKIVQQVFDPYHLVLSNSDREKYQTTQSVPTTLSRKSKAQKAPPPETPVQTIADRYNSSAKSPPLEAAATPASALQPVRPRPRVYWHETSHSSVTNEMVTDAYKDDAGSIVKPKGVTMQSETVIDNSEKESKVTTRSKAQRQFEGQIQEPEITAETSITDAPPILQIEPRRVGHPRRTKTLALSQPPETVPEAEAEQKAPESSLPVQPDAEREKRRPSSRIPRCAPTFNPLAAPVTPAGDRKKRMKSDPGKISVKSSGISSAESTTAMSTPIKSTSRTSIKSPPAFMESSLDDLDMAIPDVLSPNILSTDISCHDPESRADSGLLSSPLSPADRKSRREKIIESARKGQLFSDVNKALYGKSLSFADLNGESPGPRTRKSSVDRHSPPAAAKMEGLKKLHPKLKSSNDLDKVLPLLPSLTSSKSGTELVTRITRRTHPAEIVDVGGSRTFRPRRSKMVLEQDIKTGDGTYDTTGCQMMNKITVDNPCVKKKNRNPFGSFSFGKLKRKSSHQQLAIGSDDQEKENETKAGTKKKSKKLPGRKSSKDFSKSLGDLRAPDEEEEEENQGVMLTETKFERLVPNPATGRSNQQTSWEYSLECKCINGLNTSVKTNVKHRRSYVPMGMTLYESSV